MNLLLVLAFLFFIGSCAGWILELFYRRFFARCNAERKWINPGFCTGPYLPLYGTGLCLLFLLARLGDLLPGSSPILLILLMTAVLTALEYLTGIWCLKRTHLRLWDYTNEWGNVQGVICPRFTLYWGLAAAVYSRLIHPGILNALAWLSRNLTFSFFIGMFFGVFAVDFIHSAQLIARLKKFAEENQMVLRYEAVKLQIREHHERTRQKYHFFRPFRSELPLSEHLKEMAAAVRQKKT